MPSDPTIKCVKKWRVNHQPADPMRPQDQPRLEKGTELSKYVIFTTANTSIVKSQSGNGEYHVVLSEDGKHTCECPDHLFRRNICKHIRATLARKAEILHEAKILNSFVERV